MIKRILIFLGLLCFLGVTNYAFADWSVGVSWTRSPGPNLDYEECMLDGVSQCLVQETDPTTCAFQVTDLTGQEVTIRSYNDQGAYAETSPIALQAIPSAATGVAVTVTFIQP